MGETIGVNVLKKAQNMHISPQFDGYSGVKIFIGTDDDGNAVVVQSGDDNGRVLEIKNPFGTQEMADNILAEINGYQYQPLSAETAQLNPAAEMGDGVTVNGVYSGIYKRDTRFGPLMASDISAPTEEEIEHEFAVESASDRQYTRFVQQTKGLLKVTNLAIQAEVSAREAGDVALQSSLELTASQIRAEVVAKEGGSRSSFGWALTATGHTWYSNNQEVMKVDRNGLHIKGQLDVGTKVGSSNGFTISANAIYKNISSFGGTQSSGVYIGTDGIQLGKNFKVDSSGNLTAASGTFSGTVRAGSIVYGGSNGTLSGNGITGGSIGTSQMTSYAAGGIGGGVSWNSAKGGGEWADYLKARTFQCTNMTIGGNSCAAYTATINGVTIPYFGWGAPY